MPEIRKCDARPTCRCARARAQYLGSYQAQQGGQVPLYKRTFVPPTEYGGTVNLPGFWRMLGAALLQG